MKAKFFPKKELKGHIGFYPVLNAEEWDNLPAVYKAMEWFPVTIMNGRDDKHTVEYVEFEVVYGEPYKISAKVKVHVQEVQKILFCYFKDAQFHLHTISGVFFENGDYRRARWLQDTRTGAFAVVTYNGKVVGRQGGYGGFIPNQIKETDDGFEYIGYQEGKNRCHYEHLNPFE